MHLLSRNCQHREPLYRGLRIPDLPLWGVCSTHGDPVLPPRPSGV